MLPSVSVHTVRHPAAPTESAASRGASSGIGPRVLAMLAIAGALAWALVPVVVIAVHTLRGGGVLSGSDGALPGGDQLFYMDSIRQSGAHLLITDHFDLTIGHAVYLNPLYLVGGVLWRLGLPLPAAFWALKLLAAPSLALGAVLVAVRTLRGFAQRAAAVTLALLYFSPITSVLLWFGLVGAGTRYELLVPAGEAMPAWQLWGYPHSGIAVGALAAAVIGAVSMAQKSPSRRLVAGVAAAACIASWQHPWQGAVFILVAAALIAQSRSRRVAAALAAPMVAGIAPLIYTFVLEHSDAAWRVDSMQNSVPHVAAWVLAATLVPIAVPAAFGIRAVGAGPLRTALVVWPVAALAVYFGTSEFPYHALQGISLPLAVLAVLGWRRLWDVIGGRWTARRTASRSGAAVVAAVLAVTVIPGAAYELKTLHDSERSSPSAYFLTDDDHAALAYLDHLKTPGGVLSRESIGMAVPAFTGRRTWVGEWTWTPDFNQRAELAEQALDGEMPPSAARALIAGSRARFVLADCGARAPIARMLGALVVSTHAFGCASVYQLRPPSRS